MAVVIRLRREGGRNAPTYRVVVADKRMPRDGKFIEQLGSYDPSGKNTEAPLQLDRVDHWIKQGAKPSETVLSLVRKARKQVPAAA